MLGADAVVQNRWHLKKEKKMNYVLDGGIEFLYTQPQQPYML